MRHYIGIACTGHENALAIVDSSGEILFAEATERFLQNKRAVNTPADDPLRIRDLMERYCASSEEIVVAKTWSQLSAAKMQADAARIFKAVAGADPVADRDWINRVVFHAGLWDKLIGPNRQLAGNGVERFCNMQGKKFISRAYDHHLTHAAYACFTSPFERAVCAVFDGYGEGVHSSFFRYADGRLALIEHEASPNNLFGSLSSLGLYYGYTICSLFGFDIVNGEEWKVMGLAPYGKLDGELYAILQRHIHVDGLNLVVGEHAAASYRQLRAYARRPGQTYQDMADIAHTAQHHFNELMFGVLRHLHGLGISDNLVLAGGCALNSTTNGLVEAATGFRHLHVPPAPSDDGNAVGAALLALQEDGGGVPARRFHSPYLGSAIEKKELDLFRKNAGRLGRVEIAPDNICRYVAAELAKGKVVAWVQGRAEFGPRALGNRSILADPRNAAMKGKINAIVKFRESFRPFAPSVLDEFGERYFENYTSTPYMERTLTIRASRRAEIAAVCHADNTGRLQSVRREWNPRFYDLISAFNEITGTPMLLNTSLNVMGKPIVHSAADAISVFLSSGLDLLVIDDEVFQKDEEVSA
jgi:carbamoyltransferase